MTNPTINPLTVTAEKIEGMTDAALDSRLEKANRFLSEMEEKMAEVREWRDALIAEMNKSCKSYAEID